MSDLLDNAIYSIQLGIEDYQSNDDRRPISALRNFYAGVLLLGKECLLNAAPDAEPMEILASKFVPALDADGNLVMTPKGQTTIDLNELRERFGTFQLKWPDGNIKDLQRLRNEFEHFHSKAPKETIRQAIAACFPLVEGFFAILQKSPKAALGSAWDVMLAERAFFKKQKADCDATLQVLPWWDSVEDSSVFSCTECSSSLLFQTDASNSEPTFITGGCKACGSDFTAEETVEMIVTSVFAVDEFQRVKDGGEQTIYDCPECANPTYVEAGIYVGCYFCQYVIEGECARCSADLTVNTQSVNNPSLCDYCDHVTSRDD